MIWSMAGVLGIEPWSFTFRELRKMEIACRRERWDHTASLRLDLSAIFGGSSEISDFHPFYQAGPVVFRDARANTDAFGILKSVCTRSATYDPAMLGQRTKCDWQAAR